MYKAERHVIINEYNSCLICTNIKLTAARHEFTIQLVVYKNSYKSSVVLNC